MGNGLKDKISIIVGSSSGMGKAIAKTFAQSGAKVVLAARSAEKLEEIAAEIAENALSVPTDVKDPVAVDNLIDITLKRFGRIDILVYATGTNIPGRSLGILSKENWDMMIQTNLTGAFFCTKAALPVMRRQQAGMIIYVSSASVQMPDVSGVSYQAGKHGLVGLAHGTFVEEKKYGIRTSVIFPGLTDTPILLKRPVPTPPEVLSKALQPQDVADACLFVASLPPRAYVPEMVLLPAGLS